MKCYVCQNDFRLKELIEVEVELPPARKQGLAETDQPASGKSREMVCPRCAEKVRKDQGQVKGQR